MASITSEIASSSSSLPKWEYDVFLSFRGEDTRNNFTDHLYAALVRKGIWTFRDDERLERGKPISPELLNAIEKSKFAIIVLSRNYASSSWCLDELVKIVKTRLTVLPVFHEVDPSDVRNQRGSFAEAFAKHEAKNEEKSQSWRDALTQVANLSGWDTRNKKESTIIEEITRKLIVELNYSYPGVHEDLVGIQSRVEEMKNLCLRMGSNDVHFIGIWGMGGIGKTTIAQVLYDRIHCHFAGSSFLANVREESRNGGLVTLQKQLLSDVLFGKNIDFRDVQQGIKLISNRLCHKKVLVILDDVDQHEQLEALANKQSWFGQGSVIIITTRDKHLLIRHEVAEEKIYEPKILDNDKALKLFSLKAFKQDNPLEGYEVLSKEFVCYAQGLPLALKVLGSFMFHRNLEAWESVLGRLKETPERKILDVLQISFEDLKITEKKMFLDIACFFNGMTKDRVANILRSPHYRPIIDIDVLVEKSLITISNGTLWMHDLLQELGKEIVRCVSPDEPGGRSRLWLKEDILRVLKDNTGTEKVEGIFLKSSPNKEDNVEVNFEAFSKMRKLRLLKIGNVRLPQGLTFLSNDLRLLDWFGYPLKSMPRNFKPDKLVELIMPHSHIKQLWKGDWSLEWLRIIDLSDSIKLIKILDFARVPNLEKLILKGCTKLSKIDSSLGDLKHLILLDLTNCKNLSSLPEAMCGLTSLKTLTLSGCLKLGNMPMTKTPDLMGLVLPSLTTLNMRNCNLQEIPSGIGCLSSLKELDLSGNNFRFIPKSINQLSNLRKFVVENCKSLQYLPELRSMSPDYIDVWANGCTSFEFLLPVQNSEGYLLHLLNCFQFVKNQGRGDLFTTMLGEYFQECCYRESTKKERFDVVIPGSEVPNLFTRQSVGGSINLEVPSNLFKQFRGIAVCVVFGPRQHCPPNHRGYYLAGDEIALSSYFTVNGFEFFGHPVTVFSEEIDTIKSDHRWFMYLIPNFFDREFLEIADGSSCPLEFVFASQYSRIEIKKCAAHVVYEKEMEDLKQRSSSIIPYNEGVDVDHFEEDIRSKRSRDDENGASGEGSSTHIPHPKTKRGRPSDGE